MHKLRIPDSAGITGRTLGHTVKLPAAIRTKVFESYLVQNISREDLRLMI